MPVTQDLSFTFLEAHPIDSARVLERIAPQHVAELLAETPMRLAAPVLRAMLPLHAARCLESLADDMVSGLLRAMGPQAGVAVLHYIPQARRKLLLDQLPTALAMAFRLLLGYPEDTVGAWMNPHSLAMPADAEVSAVLERLREAGEERDAGIFVIGPDQRLLGQVDLREVLRASASTSLSQLASEAKYSLPARAAIHTVEVHAGWQEYQELPVVDRENHFVGALNRSVLAKALHRTRRRQPEGQYDDLLSEAAGSYWLGVSSLIQLVVSQIPAASPRTNGTKDSDKLQGQPHEH